MGKSSRKAEGKVWNEQGFACQRYSERNPSSSNHNFLSGLEFVVSNTTTGDEVVFRKMSYLRKVFEVFDGSDVVGTVSKRGIFRKCYTIDIIGLGHWKFYISLFSTRFKGVSDDGGNIWVSVGPSKAEWNILLDPNSNNSMIISVLVFIHNEYWNHS